jgi:hypothetical protein
MACEAMFATVLKIEFDHFVSYQFVEEN